MMLMRVVSNFIEHPITKVADAAAVVTSAAYFVPGWRAAIHEWSIIAADIAPILAVLWLSVQVVCKIIVTRHHFKNTDKE